MVGFNDIIFQNENEHVQYQPNEHITQHNAYGYADGANGMGHGMGGRQWGDYSAFGKLDGSHVCLIHTSHITKHSLYPH